eukprot:CAMPEP_0175910160 /NCGR_PEP_ID=MMETSP0108-20121206/7517_1 /TAXON_ID=195067 ORGANISM="Goniomonas pacifica, Strain CCMP1869" /NCGR_SAMPLE_ID=MMETSP0108 /ASSEMBLY_ACC=CAM_ASM_000204 /LENGTH=73 /DNA_ID=CAMNT_0017232331 /DNA_START=124 /DNA_END=342 /DNA_ORIENTATION=-
MAPVVDQVADQSHSHHHLEQRAHASHLEVLVIVLMHTLPHFLGLRLCEEVLDVGENASKGRHRRHGDDLTSDQ